MPLPAPCSQPASRRKDAAYNDAAAALAAGIDESAFTAAFGAPKAELGQNLPRMLAEVGWMCARRARRVAKFDGVTEHRHWPVLRVIDLNGHLLRAYLRISEHARDIVDLAARDAGAV